MLIDESENEPSAPSQEAGWDPLRMATLAGFEDNTQAHKTENTVVESEKSLLSEDPHSFTTEISFQNHPLAKLGLVSISTLVLVLITGTFLSTNLLQSSRPKPQKQQPQPEKEQTQSEQGASDGRVLTDLAITSQVSELEALNAKPKQVSKPQLPGTPNRQAPTPASKVPVRTNQPLKPVVAYPPRSRTYSPPQPVVQPRLIKPMVRMPVVAEPDPMKAWVAAAQLGSYGQLPVVEETSQKPAEASAEVMTTSNTTTTSPEPVVQSIASEKLSSSSKQAFSQPPPVNEAEEAPILQERPRQFISAGTQAKAILATPFVWDETEDKTLKEHFTIILAEPILAADGRVALPARSQLVTKVVSLFKAGLISLVAVAALVNSDGELTEIALPENAIGISGVQGKPLVALKLYQGRRNRGLNIGHLALSTLEEAADLFDSSAEDVVKQGTQTLLDNLSERNRRSIETVRERPRVRFLPAGTVVEVYANQSTALDTNFR